jgi:hypothetical protein
MLQRGGFDTLYIAKLFDVLKETSSASFPNIHERAKRELIEIERNLANPQKDRRA